MSRFTDLFQQEAVVSSKPTPVLVNSEPVKVPETVIEKPLQLKKPIKKKI
jgi:hypothetical protein